MGEPVRCLEATNGHDALRIFDDRRSTLGGPHGLSSRMTVGQIAELWYKPVYLVMHDSSPRNYEEVNQTVKYWMHFTGDPPIDEITVYHSRDFYLGLKSLPGRKYPTMANNTVRKHCGAIQTILDLCGRPSRDNREGLALLEDVPYIARPPKEEKPAEDCYVLEELVRLIENATAATLPKKINGRAIAPAAYHRRIYGVNFNTGMRIGGIMGSFWRHFHGDHLWLPPKIGAKGRTGKRIELNDAAREIIESMRGYDAERIFPWPRKWPSSRHNLYDQHDLIRACLPADRRDFLAYHALRKLHNNELAAINGLACMKSLGHTNGRTTVENYTSTRVVRDAVAQLPHVSLVADPQQRLFD